MKNLVVIGFFLSLVLVFGTKPDGFTTVDFSLNTKKITEKVDSIDQKTTYRLKKLNDLSSVKCSPLKERSFNMTQDYDLSICIARDVSINKYIIYFSPKLQFC